MVTAKPQTAANKRSANLRLLLILLTVVGAFFIGFVIKTAYFGL